MHCSTKGSQPFGFALVYSVFHQLQLVKKGSDMCRIEVAKFFDIKKQHSISILKK